VRLEDFQLLITKFGKELTDAVAALSDPSPRRAASSSVDPLEVRTVALRGSGFWPREG
jgi:hypothetical protein